MPNPHTVALSALQHFLYCPRQNALIHVERVWPENYSTAGGNALHETAYSGQGETRRPRGACVKSPKYASTTENVQNSVFECKKARLNIRTHESYSKRLRHRKRFDPLLTFGEQLEASCQALRQKRGLRRRRHAHCLGDVTRPREPRAYITLRWLSRLT